MSNIVPLPGLGSSYTFGTPTSFVVRDNVTMFIADRYAGLYQLAFNASKQSWDASPLPAATTGLNPSVTWIVELSLPPAPANGGGANNNSALYGLLSDGMLVRFSSSSSSGNFSWQNVTVRPANTQYRSIVAAPCSNAVNGPCPLADALITPTPTPAPLKRSSILLLRSHDGLTPYNNGAYSALLTLLEVNPDSGEVLQSLQLPQSATGSQRACTLDNNVSPQVQLTLSADGTTLTFACYDAPAGAYTPYLSYSYAPPSYRRVLARVSASGDVDTSATLQWTRYLTVFSQGILGVAALGNASRAMWAVGTDGWYANRLRYSASGSAGTDDVDLGTLSFSGVVCMKVYNGSLYALMPNNGLYRISAGSSGAFPTNASTPVTVTKVDLPYTAGNTLTSFEFQDPFTLWLADSCYSSSCGLWRFTFNRSTSSWSRDSQSPWPDPQSRGITNIAGRQEGNVFMIYAASGSTNTGVYSYRFNPAIFTYTRILTPPLPPDMFYRGAALAPCMEGINGPCDGSAASATASIAASITSLATSTPTRSLTASGSTTSSNTPSPSATGSASRTRSGSGTATSTPPVTPTPSRTASVTPDPAVVDFSATMNILAAGRVAPFPDAVAACGGSIGAAGTLPAHISLPTGATVLTVSNVSASLGCCGYNAGTGADGAGGCTTDIPSYGGISGLRAQSCLPLVAVFLSGATPPASPPARLDYTALPDGLDFDVISPALGQTFFVGDGRRITSGGAPQLFSVPPGATDVYFGFIDAYSFSGSMGW